MELVITPGGTIRMVYQEELDLSGLGTVQIQRASHVEPDEQGHWWADLSLMEGPLAGPYRQRTDALRAEVLWLTQRLAQTPRDD